MSLDNGGTTVHSLFAHLIQQKRNMMKPIYLSDRMDLIRNDVRHVKMAAVVVGLP